jgi:hypothetical protein
MPHPSSLACSVCNKTQSSETKIQRCSRCLNRLYCGKPSAIVLSLRYDPMSDRSDLSCPGTECQSSDWPSHRGTCRATLTQDDSWYNKYRKCKDGSLHEGKLELITWNSTSEGDKMGWGNTLLEESADLKAKFEGEFQGDLKKLYRYWPQAFRWTCCGMDAAMKFGCDHHGEGSKPCSCDFCRCVSFFSDSICCC